MAGQATKLNEWDVLQGLAAFTVKHGRSPSVRELKIELGYNGTGALWQMMDNLVKVGVAEWPMDGHKRQKRGIQLKVPLIEPVRIPIINSGVPGSRFVEVYEGGPILVDGQEMIVVPLGGQWDEMG
jgi:hypothetical protein